MTRDEYRSQIDAVLAEARVLASNAPVSFVRFPGHRAVNDGTIGFDERGQESKVTQNMRAIRFREVVGIIRRTITNAVMIEAEYLREKLYA